MKTINLQKINNIMIVFLMLGAFVFTRAFGGFKLPILFFVFTVSLLFVFNESSKIYFKPLLVIFAVMFGSVIWSLVGAFNGNSEEAILSAVRLYFVYYLVNLVIVLYLYKRFEYYYVDIILSVSSICVFLFSCVLIFNISIIPSWVLDSMGLRIGIHKGYIQNTGHHIGMLAFLVPYLLTVSVYRISKFPKFVFLAAVLGFISILVSSRRAIFFLILILPFIIFLFNFIVSGRQGYKSRNLFYFILFYFVLVLFASFAFYFIYPDYFHGFVARIYDAVNQVSGSNSSVRSEQSSSLLKGWVNMPLIGSGFGGIVDVVRSSKTPWVFELSYHMLLFNVGLIGFLFFVAVNIYSFYYLAFLARKSTSSEMYYSISALVAVFSMYFISYSNPYMSSSYDFLIINFMIPLFSLKVIFDRESN